MPVKILSIDPGTSKSAYIVWNGKEISDKGIVDNSVMLSTIRSISYIIDFMTIEMVGHYGTGMSVGKTVFDTCVWIGRFIEAYSSDQFMLVKRKVVVNYICGNPKAKDSNVRQAMIDRFGDPGFISIPLLDEHGNEVLFTRGKNKGLPKQAKIPASKITHELRDDEWQALALAVYSYDHITELSETANSEGMKGTIHV